MNTTNSKSNIASDATINSFSAGYKAVDATLNGLSTVAHGATSLATTTKDTTCGFFSGMKYAITERRGTKKLPKVTDEAKRKAREDLYRRAHGTTNEERGTAIIILGN